VRVAIARAGETVAPCLEYSATMAIFTIEEGAITDQLDFPLRSRDPFDRVRLLRDQEVDTVICGGVMEKYEDLLKASRIQVISWVSGPIEDLLNLFLRGQLVSRSHPGRTTQGRAQMARDRSTSRKQRRT
jgi:predicted Fe-Mo cluster-binding NifX family protein